MFFAADTCIYRSHECFTSTVFDFCVTAGLQVQFICQTLHEGWLNMCLRINSLEHDVQKWTGFQHIYVQVTCAATRNFPGRRGEVMFS